MPQPSSPIAFDYEMDPGDRTDFYFGFDDLLEDGENVSSFTLTVEAAAVLLGLSVSTDTGYTAALDATSQGIVAWLEIAEAEQENAEFLSDGQHLGIRAVIQTDHTPARTYERTFAVTVKQR